MANSKIEWTDRVWNPVTGCTKISEGCQNCYAERMSKRFAETWGLPADNPFGVRLHPERLEEPLRWSKPSRIFVCSMGDLFHEEVPFQFIHQIWGVMKKCPKHTFIVLTKRPERMKQVVNRIYSLERLGWAKGFWEHVWLGLTAENQKRAEERIPILLQIPAAVRFVSLEPMLGPVSFRWFPAWPENAPTVAMNPYNKGITNEYDGLRRLDWIICGGESGPGARPMHPDWVRSLRDQCKASNVPFFFKQMIVDGKILKMPELDGRVWDEYPDVKRK